MGYFMLKAIYKFTFIFALVAISSCGPRYETTHAYTAPQSQYGRMCVNQCLNGKAMCEQDCHARQVDCEYRAEIDAQNEYNSYVRAQKMQNRAVKKTKSSFKRYCSSSDTKQCTESCTSSHNLCYSNCGGLVASSTQCVSNCDQIK